MDLELSYLDPASYEPVFICNICNRVLTEPVCRNEHITQNFGPNPLDVDFENLIKSTVVRNSGGQPCTTETSSDSELKQGKVCAIIPHPSKSQSPTHFLCPECGEITLDAKCRKDHNFQTMKDKCPVCDVECSSLESLIRHRKDCVPIEECFSNTTDLLSSVSLQNLGEDMYGIGQPAGMNLSDNFATMVQKGTLGTGQYQVTTGFVGDNDPIMDLLDTAMDGDLSLPLSDEIDGVLEWDDSMSLAVLDLDNVTSEISVFDDFLKTDMEMVEVSKPEIQSPPVIIEDKMPIQLPAETRKLLLCKKCGEEFPDMDTFVPHHILHGYSGRFECQFCSRRYTRLHWFRFHMETHADQLPVVCKFCDDYFLSTKLHDEHLQSVHDVDHDGMDKVLLSLEVIKNNPFLCMGCGRWLKSKKHLEMHHQMHALAKRKVAAADEPIPTSMNSTSASADVSKPTIHRRSPSALDVSLGQSSI